MCCVAGTPGGRIFMGGLDGHLHELCYAPSASLWAKRCFQVRASLCRPLGLVQGLWPGWDVFSHHDPAPRPQLMLPELQTGSPARGRSASGLPACRV